MDQDENNNNRDSEGFIRSDAIGNNLAAISQCKKAFAEGKKKQKEKPNSNTS